VTIAPSIVIQHARLIDGTGAPPLAPATVIVQDRQIAYAGPDTAAPSLPPTADIVDGRGATVLPGLIDCHQHLDRFGDIPTPEQALRYSIEFNTVWGVLNSRTVLEAGFTTVRDVGCRGLLAMAVRDAVEAGLIPGPRILAAGQIISTTGGLADFYPPWVRVDGGLAIFADGVDGVVRAARHLLKSGVDLLKVEASGARPGFLPPRLPTMTEQEIAAVVGEAHRRGKRVAAHAEHLDAVKNALRARVDTIEHGEQFDDEVIDLFHRTGAMLVATLANLDRLRVTLEDRDAYSRLGPGRAADTRRRYEEWQAGFRRVYESGVPIALGSDTANRNPHGRNAVELEHLVRYGMRPLDALVAATRNGAAVCGLIDLVGTLEAGKRADLLVVTGDPLADITILQRSEALRIIMKDGVVMRRQEACASGAFPKRGIMTGR
jgi:imidazolonepropionase-like amidohydrolase